MGLGLKRPLVYLKGPQAELQSKATPCAQSKPREGGRLHAQDTAQRPCSLVQSKTNWAQQLENSQPCKGRLLCRVPYAAA